MGNKAIIIAIIIKGENVFDLLSKFIFQFIYHLSYLVSIVVCKVLQLKNKTCKRISANKTCKRISASNVLVDFNQFISGSVE